MSQLSASLAVLVRDRALPIVRVVITDAPRPDTRDGPVEHGTLSLRVVELLRGDRPQPGYPITVRYERERDPELHAGSRGNQWDREPLEPGRSLVFALRATREPGHFEARAGFGIENPEDTRLADARAACAISREDDPAVRAEGLQNALLGSASLCDYALDAITRGAVIPRPVAVALLVKALGVPGALAADVRVGFALAMVRPTLFVATDGASDVNRAIVVQMAAVIADDPDPDVRAVWIDALSTLVLPVLSDDPAEDAAVRSALVRAVPRDLAVRMVRSLDERAADAPTRQRPRELRALWTAASGSA